MIDERETAGRFREEEGNAYQR